MYIHTSVTSVLKIANLCATQVFCFFLKHLFSTLCNMVDFCEQHVCTKFRFKLVKVATECYQMLKMAFGEQAISFKGGRTSTDDDERSGQPVFRSTPEMTERVRQIIYKDLCQTTDEVTH